MVFKSSKNYFISVPKGQQQFHLNLKLKSYEFSDQAEAHFITSHPHPQHHHTPKNRLGSHW